MKKLAYLILLLVCGSAIANQADSYNSQSTANCLAITEMAKSAMHARQNRVPVTEMYKTIENQEPAVREIAKIVIDSAYRVPLATTEEEVELITLEYTNQFFSDCIKHTSK